MEFRVLATLPKPIMTISIAYYDSIGTGSSSRNSYNFYLCCFTFMSICDVSSSLNMSYQVKELYALRMDKKRDNLHFFKLYFK